MDIELPRAGGVLLIPDRQAQGRQAAGGYLVRDWSDGKQWWRGGRALYPHDPRWHRVSRTASGPINSVAGLLKNFQYYDMATERHLKILEQGVDDWNDWRIQNPDISPDLSFSDLNGRTLSWANFSEANLTYANLTDANLTLADFGRAKLSGAYFTRAHLHRAIFDLADLSGTFLNGAFLVESSFLEADLSGALLSMANLQGANLQGAVLSKASLAEAYLYRADLSGANLEDVEHLSLTQIAQVKSVAGSRLEPAFKEYLETMHPHLLSADLS